MTPAVTSTVLVGSLFVTGDAEDDTIIITVGLFDNVLVNNANPDTGFVLAENITSITVNAGAGNDTIDLSAVTPTDFTNLTSVTINGEAGNDSIIGSAFDDMINAGIGNDTVVGGPGNDVINLDTPLLGTGNNLFIWNNGDGSDTINGANGNDTVEVNGNTTLGDNFVIDNKGARVDFRRIDGGAGLGPFVLDIGNVELLRVNGLGGDDTITVNDLTGVEHLNTLELNGGDGNDTIDASALPAGVLTGGLLGVGVLIDGGAGNDSLVGSQGDDLIEGGPGNDTIVGGPGNDSIVLGIAINPGGLDDGDNLFIWNNGDGSDTINGGNGNDTVVVNGNATLGDNFVIDNKGARVDFRRIDGGAGLGPFVLDIGNVELLRVNGLGGDDTITVNDLTGVEHLNTLELNGGDGNDTIDASALPSGVLTGGLLGVGVLIDGGAGNDSLVGSQGDDLIEGGPGNDTIVGGPGNDSIVLGIAINPGGLDDGDNLFIWNNGDGSDTINGGNGKDTVLVNGSPTKGDAFVIGPDGDRVRLDRTNLGTFFLDMGSIEVLQVNGLGGDDTFTVTPLVNTTVNIDGGDGFDKLVIIPGGATNIVRGSGQITFGNRQPVNFTNVESVTGVKPVSQSSTGLLAIGAGPGGPSVVTVYNPDGSIAYTVDAFPGSTVGVRVAMADVNGNGVPDLIVGTGPGVPTLVKVFDGQTRQEIASFRPFEAAFTGGIYVAAGDLDNDGLSEVIVTPDEGGGPVVAIYSGAGLAAGQNAGAQLTRFLGITDPVFRGGARAALADINGDGILDVLVAAGFGGGPRLAVFNGQTVFTPLSAGQSPPKLFGDIFVFEDTLRNGVFITGGDINGDGFDDLLVGGGPGGGPRVFGLSGQALTAGNRVQVANFFAGNTENRGGVRIAVKDLDGDGRGDIVTASGTNAAPLVTNYVGASVTPDGLPDVLRTLTPFPADFRGGIFVG